MTFMNGMRYVSAVILCGVLAACGGGGGGGRGGAPAPDWPAPGTPPTTAEGGADLTAVQPVTDTAGALQGLALTGLPDGLDSATLYAEFYTTEGEAPLQGRVDTFRLLPVFVLDDTVQLPLPLLDTEGATIVWRLTDGASTSETFQTRIQALPAPRTGSVEALLSGTESMLEAATQALGKQYPEEWEYWRDNDPTQMPVYLVPLWQAWHAMFDTENDIAWVNQPWSAEQTTMLERVLAAQPIDEAMLGMADYIAQGHSLLDEAADLLPVRTSSGVTARSYALHEGRVAPGGIVHEAGMLPISNAAELAAALQQYDDARRFHRNMDNFDKHVGTYLTAVGVLAALPVVAGTGGEAAVALTAARRQLMAQIGNIATIFSRVNAMAKWFAPCCIPSLAITLDPADGRVTEDLPENQLWLDEARARAESEPVNLTREITDIILAEAGGALTGKLSETVAEQFSTAVQQSGLAEDGASMVIDFAASRAGKSVLERFPVGADMVFFWDDIDLVHNEPQQWLAVEARTLDGSADSAIVEQASTGSHEMAFRLRAPQAFQLQSSVLRFNTRPEALPAAAPAIDTQIVSLDYLNLRFDPPVLTVADEPVDFTLTLENAAPESVSGGDFIDVAAFLDGFTLGSAVLQQRDGEVMRFTYTPPESGFPEDTVLEVETFATLETGLRNPAYSPPVRRGALLLSADGVVQGLTVAPGAACVADGESQQFTAATTAGEPADVIWQVEGSGQITAGGRYTAGGTGSSARIIARLREDESVMAEARITLGNCSCWWRTEVAGDFQQRMTGDGQWIETDAQQRITGLFHYAGEFSQIRLDLSGDPIPPGATGSFRASVPQGYLGNSLPGFGTVWYNPSAAIANEAGLPPVPQLTVQVTRHDMLVYPDAAGVATGARNLEANITGVAVYESVEYEPMRIERLSGGLNMYLRGTYWIDLGGGDINCSGGL